MAENTSIIHTIKRVFSLLRGDGKDIWVIIIYAIGIGICSLSIPIAVKSIVNTVAFGSLLQPLVVLTSLVGGVLFISGIMSLLRLYVVEIIQRRLVVRVALMLTENIPHVEYDNFKSRFGSEYIVRFMEVFFLQKIISLILLDGISIFFQIIIGLTLVSFYHPIFFGFATIIIFAMLFIIFVIGYGSINTSIRESNAKYDLVNWLQDVGDIPVLFKSGNGEKYALKKTDELALNYLTQRSSHFRVLFRQHVSTILLQIFGSSLLLGIGGWLVINQQLTLGQFIAAELILGNVLVNITKTGKHFEKFYDLSASIAKLDSLVNLPIEELSGKDFISKESPATLTIKQLSIDSGSINSPIFKNISFSLKSGEKAIIWGENGSGKSRLANIVYKLAKPSSGRIEIDNNNIQDIHPMELRSQVALVRGIEIFHGTIEENLCMGNFNITPSEIRDALHSVDIGEHIFSLKDGLKTVLRSSYGALSFGQACKLMIARAILQKPRLLILDGILDSIDSPSLSTIIKSLKNPNATWTLLAFTHEKSILENFESVYDIKDFSIIPSK